MTKKFISIVALSLVAFISLFASAKAQTASSDYFNLQPQVYVKDLVLDKSEYKAGDTVNGFFTVINARDFGAQDLNYKIFLVGDYNPDGGLYNYEWDNQQFGPVSLDKNESKNITFSYTLPQSSEGYSQGKQLGIKAWFFTNDGSPLGWTDTFIKISGATISPLNLTDTSLVVDGKSFGLQDGPMLYPGKTASLNLTLTNPSAGDINVSPNLKIYDISSTEKPVGSSVGANILLKASTTDNNVQIDLPTFSGRPGVYLGEVSLKDTGGVARTGTIRFRYIVAGDFINVKSLIADKTSFNAGDTVGLKMTFSGSPHDISLVVSSTTPVTSDTVNFVVSLFNENDQLVGDYGDQVTSQYINGVSLMNFSAKDFSIKAAVGAKAVYAKAVFTKDGNIIGTYTTKLSNDFDAVKAGIKKEDKNNLIPLVGSIVIILLVITFFLFRLLKSKKVNAGDISVVVLFLLLALPGLTFATTTTTVPGAPTIGTALLNNGNVSVSFTAPASDGGSPITSYTAVGGGITAVGTQSPIVLTGFKNAGTFTFTVKAKNAIGTSAASAPSNSIKLAAPGAPIIGTATLLSNGNTSVSFTASSSNGGSPVVSYTVTSSGGGLTTTGGPGHNEIGIPGSLPPHENSSVDDTLTATGTSNSLIVTGFKRAGTFTFTVKAKNAIGTSAASAPSNKITLAAPGAPTGVTAVAGNGQATVSFTPPVSNGGSPVTSYTVTANGGQTAVGTQSPIKISGLYNGRAYTFTVKATNAVGTSVASVASQPVTTKYVFVQSGWNIIGAGPWSLAGWYGDEIPNVVLNSPLPSSMQYYQPGQTVNIQGTAYINACGNGSGLSLTVYAKPLVLAANEPNLSSSGITLGTIASYNHVTSVVTGNLGGYYNAKNNKNNFTSIYSGVKGIKSITCNGTPDKHQYCGAQVFSGSYKIASTTPFGIYRLYILSVSGLNDRANNGDGQVLGYQDIKVGNIPSTCSNGVRDGNETGVDCGGSCPVCSPTCGNGVIDTGEVCDSSNLNGATCSSVNPNFTGGTLSCSLTCSSYNTSLCTGLGGCTGDACNSGGNGHGGTTGGSSCSNGIKDPGETGVDCGGPCPACYNTGSCTISNVTGSSTLNQATNWLVSSNCTQPCTYLWSGSNIASSSPISSMTNTFSKIYTTIGLKTINVDVINADRTHYCSPNPSTATTIVNFGGGGTNEK